MTHDWFTHPALCPDNVTTDAKPIGSPEARRCEWMWEFQRTQMSLSDAFLMLI